MVLRRNLETQPGDEPGMNELTKKVDGIALSK